MSVVSRVVLAGLICASMVGVQIAAAAPPAADGQTGNTGGRFVHATKCITTLGFGEGCDKDAPVSKQEHEAKKAEKEAKVTKVSSDTGTGRQFQHAAKCVGTLGFGAGCDKKQPYGTAENQRVAAEPAEPDHSTRSQFFHATKCLGTMGFGGGCDKK
jgi:hypothetical protein